MEAVESGKPEVATNNEKAAKNKQLALADDEARRIPLHKKTVALICKEFGIDFKPGSTLQQIRKIFKERTQMFKKTPELRDAIARQAHNFCRGIILHCLPKWFEIYHVVTLMRLMSKFNVNNPTYYVEMIMEKKKARKVVGCVIRFLSIEDCRQLLYDMQGLHRFKSDIKVCVDLDMCPGLYKLVKSNEFRNEMIDQIKQFRKEQPCWIPLIKEQDRLEVHEVEEELRQSQFPLQNMDAVNAIQHKKEFLVENDNKSITRNANGEKAEDIVDFRALFERERAPENMETEVEDHCGVVVIDKVPSKWGDYELRTLIKNVTGCETVFSYRTRGRNDDKTVRHLVKFATYDDGAKVCTAMNGMSVHDKELQVYFEPGNDFGYYSYIRSQNLKVYTLKRQLDSDYCLSLLNRSRSLLKRSLKKKKKRKTGKSTPKNENLKKELPSVTCSPETQSNISYKHDIKEEPLRLKREPTEDIVMKKESRQPHMALKTEPDIKVKKEPGQLNSIKNPGKSSLLLKRGLGQPDIVLEDKLDQPHIKVKKQESEEINIDLMKDSGQIDVEVKMHPEQVDIVPTKERGLSCIQLPDREPGQANEIIKNEIETDKNDFLQECEEMIQIIKQEQK